MKIDEKIRKKIFWQIDRKNHSEIRNIYNEMKDEYENGVKVTKSNKKIRDLLNHAIKNTEFYKEIEDKEIEKFPVVNKIDYIENKEKFLAKNISSNHEMSTSGSTGTPLTVIQDRKKRKSVLAEVIFWGEVCGYEIGMKQASFRVWTEKNRKNKFEAMKQNLEMIDVSNLNKENLSKIVDRLERKNVKSILSYASALDELSKYLEEEKGGREFDICSIISSSELLTIETRRRLKDIFKCNIVSRYSNQENGILGQEIPGQERFLLNTTNYYFEVLNLNSNEKMKDGELGKIVITDLRNYAMPMIRYDTGDVGAIVVEKVGEKTHYYLESLSGRKVDMILNTDGEVISPHIITNNMWGIEGVKQFKFIQETKDRYVIELNLIDKIDKEKLIRKFKKILGEKSNIQIKEVNEIPVLASGKRKYIENIMEK